MVFVEHILSHFSCAIMSVTQVPSMVSLILVDGETFGPPVLRVNVANLSHGLLGKFKLRVCLANLSLCLV